MTEAVFFSDANHKGKSKALGPGRYVLAEDFNDIISSVRVPAGWTVTLFDGRDFDGERIELTSDAISLDGRINDRTSSILITAAKADAALSPGEGTARGNVHVVYSLA
ncbi:MULTISPECIES: hypothetical protein [Streptomyces]|uniref:hypothetical protein n=1 Tax=Streptomyces TaxID=1883 RepID=UPI002259818B|nr:hypothetical protein [Streptomyces sp. NBC_00160]MCX5308197.1 beta/gamma crystallin family protein [Streptomyces sp. NBC_00160]